MVDISQNGNGTAVLLDVNAGAGPGRETRNTGDAGGLRERLRRMCMRLCRMYLLAEN